MYSFYLLPIIILFTEEQLKIDFKKAIAAIKSGEDAHKFVGSATHIADRVEELVIAEIKKSDDSQLKRNLTIAKDTLHERKTIYTCRILKSKAKPKNFRNVLRMPSPPPPPFISRSGYATAYIYIYCIT